MTNILLVDDNANNRLTLELILEDVEDVTLYEAENGEEAIEKCIKYPIDLIFMDIMMPVLDGIGATEKIKAFAPEVMIIALSALDDNESKHKMLLVGAEDYLTKPIDSQLFLQRVKNYTSIIKSRQIVTDSDEAYNPFSRKLLHRQLKFFVPHQGALTEFWDFSLTQLPFTCIDFSDHIRIIYGIGLWLLEKGVKFQIIMEGNDKYVYISVVGTSILKKHIVHNICQKHLPDATFVVDNNNIYFQLTKIELEIEEEQFITEKEVIVTSQESKKILAKTHNEDMDAAEYVATTAISIMPKIESLEFLEGKIDMGIIHFEQERNDDSLEELCTLLDEYCGVIDLLQEFEHLGFGVKSLITFLRTLKDRYLEKDKISLLATSLLNLLHDLSAWREQIFIKQEALNIHYLDASLLSSCMQIEAIFEDKAIDEGDDLEFF